MHRIRPFSFISSLFTLVYCLLTYLSISVMPVITFAIVAWQLEACYRTPLEQWFVVRVLGTSAAFAVNTVDDSLRTPRWYAELFIADSSLGPRETKNLYNLYLRLRSRGRFLSTCERRTKCFSPSKLFNTDTTRTESSVRTTSSYGHLFIYTDTDSSLGRREAIIHINSSLACVVVVFFPNARGERKTFLTRKTQEKNPSHRKKNFSFASRAGK